MISILISTMLIGTINRHGTISDCQQQVCKSICYFKRWTGRMQRDVRYDYYEGGGESRSKQLNEGWKWEQ